MAREGAEPHRHGTFTVSKNPEFAEKVASEKGTHDYVRHGTTNLFAAPNVGTGEVCSECQCVRDGVNFKGIHVVLDNLSTQTTPQVQV